MQFGTGGDDSKIFVKELFDAYGKYASSLGLKIEKLLSKDGHIIAQVCGKGVWQAFKNEGGKHCIQRVPPTEHKGRRQTSIISVALLPLRPPKEYTPIPDNEIEIITQRGSGPGGQHRNKTDTAVRMTHIHTGIQVFIDGRSQDSNKSNARKILTARVQEKHFAEQDREYGEKRKKLLGDGGRSGKVRTYNCIKSRVVDHRLNTKTSKVKQVLEKGEFGLLFE